MRELLPSVLKSSIQNFKYKNIGTFIENKLVEMQFFYLKF